MKVFSFRKPVTIKKDSFIVEDLAYNHKYVKTSKYGKNYLMVSEDNYQCFYDEKGNFKFIEYTLHNSAFRLILGSPIREETIRVKQFPKGYMSITKTTITVNFHKQLESVIFEFSFPQKESVVKFYHREKNGKSIWVREGEMPIIGEITRILAENR